MRVNVKRLEENIMKFASFGMNGQGGIDRSFGSEADRQAREWLIKKVEALGARVIIDAISNIWIRMEPELAAGLSAQTGSGGQPDSGGSMKLSPLTIGSHHDAVPNGGKYDGAMGILLGLEIMETLKENGAELRHPFQVVSFTAEEPNLFNISTMGSRSVTGKLDKELLLNAKNTDTGEGLTVAIARTGGNITGLEGSQLTGGHMAAFIECHIEQGRNLYDRELSTAVVSTITGIYRELIQINGEPNHAGTTIMQHRHDALLAASEAALAVEKTVSSFKRNDVVGTVGKMGIYPNSANIIPGKAEFIMEIRIPDSGIKQQIISMLDSEFAQIEKKRKVIFERKVILDQAEAPMNPIVMEALSKAIAGEQGTAVADAGLKTLNGAPMLVSMAGHDAVHMSGIAKTGMLFVQSIDGKSHCADEATDMKDMETAGNVLLKTILELDKELDH